MNISKGETNFDLLLMMFMWLWMQIKISEIVTDFRQALVLLLPLLDTSTYDKQGPEKVILVW